jgi:hypothetical protein
MSVHPLINSHLLNTFLFCDGCRLTGFLVDCRVIDSLQRRMSGFAVRLLCLAGLLVLNCVAIELNDANGGEFHSWLLNYPKDFHNRSAHLGDGLVNVAKDPEQLKAFEKMVDYFLPRVDGFTDGEVVDALEHFFWGQRNGLAIELGALDGSANTKSQTVEYEKTLGWRRILIEGDPTYKDNLLKHSHEAFIVNAAICANQARVHFSDQTYTGGILEFMSNEFFKTYHTKIYSAGVPPGNLSSIDWNQFPHVKVVDCIPLSTVLHKARARHVNYFILDVEVRLQLTTAVFRSWCSRGLVSCRYSVQLRRAVTNSQRVRSR